MGRRMLDAPVGVACARGQDEFGVHAVRAQIDRHALGRLGKRRIDRNCAQGDRGDDVRLPR